MNTYRRDEFDAVPESPRRQGVHRTRPGSESGGGAPSGRGLRWILVAGLLALVIGALAFFVLPRLGLSGASTPAASTATAVTSAPTSSAPSASAPATQGAAPSTAPSSTRSSASAAPPSPSTPAAQVDKSLEVGVYNGTTTAGLGTRVAAVARSAGWTVSAVGNWAGTPVNTSVVYYKGAAQEASARAVAADVGISTVLEVPALGLPLAVVVGPGYTG